MVKTRTRYNLKIIMILPDSDCICMWATGLVFVSFNIFLSTLVHVFLLLSYLFVYFYTFNSFMFLVDLFFHSKLPGIRLRSFLLWTELSEVLFFRCKLLDVIIGSASVTNPLDSYNLNSSSAINHVGSLWGTAC